MSIRYREEVTAPDSAEATSDTSVGDAIAASDAAAAPASQSDDLDAVIGAQWADEESHATALTWVDAGDVAERTTAGAIDDGDGAQREVSLLRDARLRPLIARPALLVPLALLTALGGAYAGTTILWPLHEVPPTVAAVEVTPALVPTAEIAWPAQGSAAVGVGGIGATTSSLDAATIASVTKVVSSLMVLDRMPLAVGEQGPEFAFTRADNLAYWQYRRSDQSALDVPVGGTLTEYQMLQGTLLGSANNYIDRLAGEIWGSDAAFASAAEVWLRDRGIEGITVVNPSGFDAGNVATPEALITLAEKAMQNPVFASIVGTPSVDLPGAGNVVNTNGMLADAGVVGVKTGTLGESWNLLTAKDITVDETTVHLYAAVLGQPDNEQRLAVTRSLFEQVEIALQGAAPAVPEGTVVGTVSTIWGTTVEVVTAADSDLVLWNGVDAQTSPEFHLGENRDSGDVVGALTSVGPLNSVTTPVALDDDVEGPSPWWRLTHPLELFGLTDAQR